MKYKVFLPTAGTGSRMKPFSDKINKGLLTLAQKPILSHIVEKFPAEVEIVVALGHKGNLVRDFLEIAYPEKKFTFVEIDKYDGDGSGLGYTMLQCKKHLQLPFVFFSCDTVVRQDIPLPVENWMGYAECPDVTAYRSIRLDGVNVGEICSKGAKGDVKAYIGLAFMTIKSSGKKWKMASIKTCSLSAKVTVCADWLKCR
jgi:hypothetical protein